MLFMQIGFFFIYCCVNIVWLKQNISFAKRRRNALTKPPDLYTKAISYTMVSLRIQCDNH